VIFFVVLCPCQAEWKELGDLIQADRRAREERKRKLELSRTQFKPEGVEASEGGHGGQNKALNNFNFMKVGVKLAAEIIVQATALLLLRPDHL